VGAGMLMQRCGGPWAANPGLTCANQYDALYKVQHLEDSRVGILMRCFIVNMHIVVY
jgi:hypothetical protein